MKKFRFWGPFGEWEADNAWEREYLMMDGETFAWEKHAPINELFASCKNRGITAMQYIGREDGNGQEIFEKDVIQNNNGARGVIEDIQTFQWLDFNSIYFVNDVGDKSKVINRYRPVASIHDWSKWVIIGNALENPELLEDV